MPALTDTRLLRAALRYGSLGWRVLPLHAPDATRTCSCSCSCGREDCPKPGKHPRTRHGFRDATARAETISAWWSTWPDANVGLATGALFVVDVDGTAGDASLQRLEREHAPLPQTLEATTCRGRHLYFSCASQRLGNSAGRLGDGLDVRGHGGYVVAPPSLHADGHRYRWRSRRRPAVLPAWIAQLLTVTPTAPPRPVSLPPVNAHDRRHRYFDAALRAELADVATAQPGTRNDTLNRAAYRLAQLGGNDAATMQALEQQLLAAAEAAGLAASEAVPTIASALAAGQLQPRR